jgi:hypothetical protein
LNGVSHIQFFGVLLGDVSYQAKCTKRIPMEHAGVFVNLDDLLKVVGQAFDDADRQLA